MSDTAVISPTLSEVAPLESAEKKGTTPANPMDVERLNALYDLMEMQDKRACRRAKQRALQLKEEEGITQDAMAKRAGWSQGNLAVYLNGKPIGRNVMPRLCLALDCEPHDIRPEMSDPRDERDLKALKRQVKQTMAFMETLKQRGDLSGGVRVLLEKQLSGMQNTLDEIRS